MSPTSLSSDNFRRQNHFCGTMGTIGTCAISTFPLLLTPVLPFITLALCQISFPGKEAGANDHVSSPTASLRVGHSIGMSSVLDTEWDSAV